MRVTNSMTTNRLLQNLNKNMIKMNKLEYQAETGNKIRYASDNPIIASRALKFRTNLSEVDQYLANVDQGMAWLETTSAAVQNVIDAAISGSENSIRTVCVAAATATNRISESKIYANQIKETLRQLVSQMNHDYAGRYIFSGFKTDQHAFFDADQPNANYSIKQEVTKAEANTDYKVYSKETETSMPKESIVTRIKLPYDTGISGLKIVQSPIPVSPDTPVTIATPTVVQSSDPIAYNPAPGAIYFVEDTGELIFDPDTFKSLPNNFGFSYDKTNCSQYDINPIVYFKEVTDNNTGKIYTMENNATYYEFGAHNKMQVNLLAFEVLPTKFLNDIQDIITLADNVTLSDKSKLTEYFKQQGFNDSDSAKKVEEQLTNETKFYNDRLELAFTELIGKLDTHLVGVSNQNTSLGTRLSRLELLGNRLQDDRLSFEELKTNNENVDISETYVRLESMVSVYKSSLQIGAQIMKMTLVDFV